MIYIQATILMNRVSIKMITKNTNLVLSTTDSRLVKIENLRKIMLSFCVRQTSQKDTCQQNELENRRRQKKMWIQALIIIKMYCSTLAELIDELTLCLRWIERERLILDAPTYLTKEYESLGRQLDHMNENGYYAGEAMIRVALLLQNNHLRLGASEIQAVFSLSDIEWQQYAAKCKLNQVEENDIIHVLTGNVGTKAIQDFVIHVFFKRAMENNITRDKVKWNAASIFKNILV